MIKGKQIQPRLVVDKPSVNYRELEALNQSMLKLFDEDPVKFFEEYKLGRKGKEKSSTTLDLGELVDFYLLECDGKDDEFQNRFDEKFVLFEDNKGSGQAFILADLIYDETLGCLDENGETTCTFQERFDAAVEKIRKMDKYKGKSSDDILKDFTSKALDYFEKKTENIGKKVVEVSLVDKAKNVGDRLKTDEFSRGYFLSEGEQELLKHYVIEWVHTTATGKKMKCKSELDMFLIDHDARTLQPLDLKTTYDNELFDYSYLKHGYYIQAAFYSRAIAHWASDNKLESYAVLPMIFIVGDTSANNRRPLVYHTSAKDLHKAWAGFSIRGTRYRGVNELLEDIGWAEESNEWRCSRDAYARKGQMKVNIDYDGGEE